MTTVGLTAREKAVFIEWIMAAITDQVIPEDEGNADVLAYNLAQLILHHPAVAPRYQWDAASLAAQAAALRAWGRVR